MTEEKRAFKGVWIPAFVYLNRDVSWNAKIIWAEIDNFTSDGKDCFFSNKYLAEFLGCSIAQVTRYLVELKDKGWVEEVGFDGRKRYLKSLLDSSFLRRQENQISKVRPSKNAEHKIPRVKIPSISTEESKDSSFQKPSENNTQQLSIEVKNTNPQTPYQRCVEHWLKVVNPGWQFRAVDGKSMKGIIDQMINYSIAKRTKDGWANPNPTTNETVNFFIHFCQKLPDFYKSQTLTVLNSKFDSIMKIIKTGNNGKSTTSKTQQVRDYINSFS